LDHIHFRVVKINLHNLQITEIHKNVTFKKLKCGNNSCTKKIDIQRNLKLIQIMIIYKYLSELAGLLAGDFATVAMR